MSSAAEDTVNLIKNIFVDTKRYLTPDIDITSRFETNI